MFVMLVAMCAILYLVIGMAKQAACAAHDDPVSHLFGETRWAAG